MNLVIYKEDKTELSPISFLNDLQNQTRISQLPEIDFRSNLALIMTKCNNLLGIKQGILDLNKQDIVELIKMRYKGLSLNEIDYAFKLERYGTFGKRIDHFQLFNAEYVSKVIDRYLEWKIFQLKNKVKTKTSQPVIDHNKENELVLQRFYNRFQGVDIIPDEYFYIYDILEQKKELVLTLEQKNKIAEIARKQLESESKKLPFATREEKKEVDLLLENIRKKQGIFKMRCKVLAVKQYMNEQEKRNN